MGTALYINDWTIEKVKKHFYNFKISVHSPSGSWQTSRHIQFFVEGYDNDLHYEYRIDGKWNGRVELHFEGDWNRRNMPPLLLIMHCLIFKASKNC